MSHYTQAAVSVSLLPSIRTQTAPRHLNTWNPQTQNEPASIKYFTTFMIIAFGLNYCSVRQILQNSPCSAYECLSQRQTYNIVEK